LERLSKYFFELKFRDELNIESVIWHDSHLNLGGKIIFYRELFDKGGEIFSKTFSKLISPTSDFHLIKLLMEFMFMTSLI
jgi:hypothetical protein